MTDHVHEWRTAAYKAVRERDEARADLEKWDDLRAETHEQMRAGLTELIQSKWDAEACDPDAAMAADTVLDYLENDFAGQLARMQQRAGKAEARLAGLLVWQRAYIEAHPETGTVELLDATARAGLGFPLPVRADGSHHYVSSSCACTGDKLMADGRTGHEYCAAMTGWQGAKRGGQAKCCGAPCQCECHTTTTEPS